MKPQFILYQPKKIEKTARIANQEQNSFVADDGNYGRAPTLNLPKYCHWYMSHPSLCGKNTKDNKNRLSSLRKFTEQRRWELLRNEMTIYNRDQGTEKKRNWRALSQRRLSKAGQRRGQDFWRKWWLGWGLEDEEMTGWHRVECKEEHSRRREQHGLSQGPKRTPGRMSEMRLRKGAGCMPLTTPKLQYLLKNKVKKWFSSLKHVFDTKNSLLN